MYPAAEKLRQKAELLSPLQLLFERLSAQVGYPLEGHCLLKGEKTEKATLPRLGVPRSTRTLRLEVRQVVTWRDQITDCQHKRSRKEKLRNFA
jgi:hypothetical protein